MQKIKIGLVLFFLYSFFSFQIVKAADIKIQHLKTEYTETPLGIDIEKPRFSWQMQSGERGIYQKAYQVVVKDENKQTVWDSGKRDSDISLNIRYEGTPLKPCTRYYWEVSVWDKNNKKHTAQSWFETGLMNPDPNFSAWDGATWIGGGDEDMVFYPDYLPVFKINYTIQLDETSNSTKAGFIYGANDERLMNKNKNLYGLENKKDSSYLRIELDIAPLQSGNAAQLHIYRVGYHPEDRKDLPFKSYEIPTQLIDNSNKYQAHTVYICSVLGYTHIYIDKQERENLIDEINLNPLGQGGDFIAFPMVGEIGFSVPEGQTANFSKLEIRNYRSPSNVLFSEKLDNNSYQSIFSRLSNNISISDNSYRVEGNGSDAFVLANPQRNSIPMLRTTFSTSKPKIAKARLYVTSRGIYEVYINGKRIGDDYLNPGLTQYNKTHLYQTYDVTDYILFGKNAMGAILSEGWWSGGATYMGDFWNFFGDRQSVLAKLVISYADGSEEAIVTNPETWKYYNDSPIVYGSFFQGEIYDANKEAAIKGWTTADYNDSNWKKTVEVGLQNHISHDPANKRHNMPLVDDYSDMALIGQFGETVKKIKEISAVSVEEVRPGVFVYDMGQNMAGVPKIELKNRKAGEKIVLRFAEVKYPDLPEYKDHTGMIMLENIRAAMAQDIYIIKEGDQTINPRFTFHGYRFVEITGISEPLPIEAVKGEVLSSIHELASYYETSNPKVNKLWENITWSTYGNFISIPTDCPQRNERLGWSGDISVFSRTATYLANTAQFLRRHMLAMRDTQREDGRFADIAPLGGGFGGVLWGSAGITVAWESYRQYNDKDLLAEHYDAMKEYIAYILEKNIDPVTNILVQEHPGAWGNLGDWLSPEDDRNDRTLLWEAYFIYDLELMSKIATVLDKKEDAGYFSKLYEERKSFFNKTYIDRETGKTIYSAFGNKNPEIKKFMDTQVSYVLPVAFDLLNEENKEKVLDSFIHTVARENRTDIGVECPPYSLMTGFIGTAWISKALSDNGYTDIAYRLFQQTEYPSWLYSVEQGTTTIWERLNSYTHVHGFGGNNRMNSFNHYSFGAIGAWMYAHSLGIERNEDSAGFKHFVLKPEPDPTGQMTYAKGHYDSMYGRIESSWKIDGNTCTYDFTIPANTSATLYLKAASLNDIKENNKLLKSSKGVKYISSEDDLHAFEVQSGKYNIQVANHKR